MEELIAIMSFVSFHSAFFPLGSSFSSKICQLEWQAPLVLFKGNWYLGGAARCDELGTRSLIMKSTNDGKNWQEVGISKEGCTAGFLQKAGHQNMFAALTHIVAGPGSDSLITTVDGNNWTIKGDFYKGKHPQQLRLFKLLFTDKRHGTVEWTININEESSINLDFISSNSGKTWEFHDAHFSENSKTVPSLLPQKNDTFVIEMKGKNVILPNNSPFTRLGR